MTEVEACRQLACVCVVSFL